MHPLFEELLKKGPAVTDGAWGTQMAARGLETGDNADAWNLTHPDKVEEVARAYVEAGSQIILTNTFQSNRFTLEGHGLADQVKEINRAGAEISKRATGNRAKVFASVGPTGKMLVMGDVTEQDLADAFQQQIDALAEGGADAIAVETMSDPAEARLAVAAAKKAGLPVVACMCYDSGKDSDRTMMGTTPEQAVEVLSEAGADAIGANCGQGIVGYISICKRLHAATSLPIWIKANAGLPEMVEGKTVYRTTAGEFASRIPELVAAGASFVGGCCGTSPDFIRATREALGR